MYDHLRMADDDDATIEGWLVPFSGHVAGGKDSYGTTFSARTDYRLDWFSERPLLYQHGLDGDTGLTPVGRIRALDVRDKGVWMKAQLDKQGAYFAEIRQMVETGKLYLSSGSVEHLVKIDQRSAHVDVWPIVEGSLTPTPANLLADIPVRQFRAAVRTELPADVTDDDTIIHDAIRAVWTTKYINSLPNSSFAYVEPGAGTDKSKRHLPYKDKNGKPDAAHVRNALARLEQTDIPASAKASAKRKLLVAARTLGIETADSATKSADPGRVYDMPGIGQVRVTLIDAARAEVGDAADMDDDEVGSDERSFEDICSDLDELLNPMYANAYTRRLNTYPTHVLVKRCEYSDGYGGHYSLDDDDESVTYWDIPYTLGSDQEPVLGVPVEVQRNESFTPVARTARMPLTYEADHLTRYVAAFTDSTRDYGERRYREGRMLSAGNMQTISDVADGLESHAKSLRDLHERAMAKQEEAARAALFADPESRRAWIEMLDL